jgi:hypothetical protein
LAEQRQYINCEQENGRTRDNAGGGQQREIAASRRRAAATRVRKPAEGWRNDSLGRLWRGSRSLKRAFCRSLGPKTAVNPALRDERVTTPWVATAFFNARCTVPTCSRQAACSNATSSRRIAPLFPLFESSSGWTGSSDAMCHPSQCTAWRQGQGLVKAPSPQTLLPCAQFRALAQRARTPSTSKNMPKVRRSTERAGRINGESAALWPLSVEVFVSYLMFCDVSSAVSPGLCPDAPLLRVKCSICFCLSPSIESKVLYIRLSGM